MSIRLDDRTERTQNAFIVGLAAVVIFAVALVTDASIDTAPAQEPEIGTALVIERCVP